MALVLNGSTGITSPGGDTSTSLSTGLLTVTGSTVPANGMYLPTTNTLAWATNSTERLRLDASGNLGLGVTPSAAPTGSFFVKRNISGTSTSPFILYYNATLNAAETADLYINNGYASRYYQNNGAHYWSTAASGTAGNAISFTQAMTLDASGNLLVGTTSGNGGVRGFFSNGANGLPATSGTTQTYGALRLRGGDNAVLDFGCNSTNTWLQATDLSGLNNTYNILLNPNGGNVLVGTTSQINSCKVGVLFDEQVYIGLVLKSSNATTGGSYQYFVNSSGALAGNIAHTGATTVAYNASSDQRLKENITDAPSALDSVNAIKVRSFDWKADGSHVDYGYIAQELIEVVPEAVHTPADPEEMMGVDFGKLTPRLVKAIQELTARLEALEGAK